MDTYQHTTLMDALRQIPDPRKARGKRHDWLILLTLIASAVASGNQNVKWTHCQAQPNRPFSSASFLLIP